MKASERVEHLQMFITGLGITTRFAELGVWREIKRHITEAEREARLAGFEEAKALQELARLSHEFRNSGAKLWATEKAQDAIRQLSPTSRDWLAEHDRQVRVEEAKIWVEITQDSYTPRMKDKLNKRLAELAAPKSSKEKP